MYILYNYYYIFYIHIYIYIFMIKLTNCLQKFAEHTHTLQLNCKLNQ